MAGTVTNPEARWPVFVALVGVGGISLSLPHSLVVGPRWLLLVLVLALLIPATLAHRAGNHRIDMLFGYADQHPDHARARGFPGPPDPAPALQDRFAGFAACARRRSLWVTNVLVFAIWYWRLDAGGPHAREKRGGHTAGAFFFPQMMDGVPIEHPESWMPRFVDYLFLAFNTSTAFSPTDTAILSRWAKGLCMLQSLICALDHRDPRLPRGGNALTSRVLRCGACACGAPASGSSGCGLDRTPGPSAPRSLPRREPPPFHEKADRSQGGEREWRLVVWEWTEVESPGFHSHSVRLG